MAPPGRSAPGARPRRWLDAERSERDRLFTELLAAEAAALHLQTIEVDVDTTVDDVAAMVREALAI
jgi:hypothetical protein